MSEGDYSSPAQTLDWDLSETDIADLVRGIDRRHIIELVKHNKYLQQNVFRGFRPNHLPWEQVPVRLARDVSGDSTKVETLLKLWQESNRDLLEEVAGLSVDDLREGIIELLIRYGMENGGKILWALRLDSRPEVQEALKQGLEQELSGETSTLISRAQSTLLAEALETARKQLAEAGAESRSMQTELDDLRRLVRHKTEQAQRWRASYEAAVAEQEQLRTKITELEERHQVDQEAIAELQSQLGEEQGAAQELRRSVADLKATLRAQAEERGTDEALLELEEERKTSARLRLKVEKLEQRLVDAYTKRDRALEQIESLQRELGQVQHDKDVIINEKRRLKTQLERLQIELKDLRVQRDERAYEHILSAMPIADLDSTWLDARTTIREHIHSVLSTLRAEGEVQVKVDKATLWREWVEREVVLVKDVLAALDVYPETQTLPDQAKLQEAQRLLALRWYLLEYTRQAIRYAEQQIAFPV